MSALFEEYSIRGLRLPNRFVRSATWEGLATDMGAATESLEEMMGELARGEVGLVISGHAFVRPDGQAGPGQLGIHSDALIPGLRRLVDAVHREGGAVAAQLAHAGFHAPRDLTGRPAVAPSSRVPGDDRVATELPHEGIAEIVDAFARAAARARRAGFDAVQVHAAHTYLLGQFLSPYYNRRPDQYGGAVADRARAVLEVVAAVRDEVGPDYPVLVKVNAADFLEGGLGEDDSLEVCRLLDRAGVDAIEISGGNLVDPRYRPARPGRLPAEGRAYYREAALRVRRAVACPVVLVGGIRSLELAEGLVAEGTADLIALCRPLIREPDLVGCWRRGDRRPSDCLSDNRCYEPLRAGDGLYCVHGGRAGA